MKIEYLRYGIICAVPTCAAVSGSTPNKWTGLSDRQFVSRRN
jgi:hypothetical protein